MMSDSSEDDSSPSSTSSQLSSSSDSSEDSDMSSENDDNSSEDNDSSSDDDDRENTWDWNYDSPNRKLKSFNEKSNVLPQGKFRPIDAFFLLFTEELFRYIWEQTNIYGKQQNKHKWVPVSINDIKKWIGINILMGYHKLPSYKNYWSTDPNFRVPLVSETMSRNFFTKILRNIHLANNEKAPPKTSKKYSKTYKVDEFLQILKNNFQENYVLSENVSIDESMIKFKGRSSLKQYLPMKPIKRGFKVWILADAKNGYVYEFEIYKGKDSERRNSLSEHIVKKLSSNLEFSYRKIYFDNYFSSPYLLDYLYKKGLYAAGTVRVDRRYMPKEFCKSKNLLQRGEYEYITSGKVVLYKWMDRKLVFLLSNFHDPETFEIIQRKEKNGGKQNVQCPTAISDYNKYMGGVDRADQRKESYSLDRKSKRFWHRIFFNFLNIALSNSFVLFKNRNNSNMTYLSFLSSITTALIDTEKVNRRTSSSIYINKKNKKLSGRKLQFDMPNKNEPHLTIFGAQRRCAFCSTDNNNNRSHYHCSHCNRAFCITSTRNCFYKYHKRML